MFVAVTLTWAAIPAIGDEMPTVAAESPTFDSLGVAMSAPEFRNVHRVADSLMPRPETVELLNSIPDDHPLKSDLRRIAVYDPPRGFTAEQWIRLAMKFDFRSAGSASLRGDILDF